VFLVSALSEAFRCKNYMGKVQFC